MLQILLDFGFLISYFLLSLLLPLLAFLSIFFTLFYLQSRITILSYYRIILPELRKNRLLYWLIGWPAVASHEILGHALVSAITGSSPQLYERISPERSAVKISHRRTAWGYLSGLLATLAPCFAPPLLILLAFYLLFPSSLSFFSPDLASSISLLSSNFLSILSIFNSDLSSPSAFFFVYLLSTISPTSGASKEDFHIILRQTRRFWYFALFLLLAFSFGLELLRAVLQLPTPLPILFTVSSLLLLTFLISLLGTFLSLLLTLFLFRMNSFPFPLKLLCGLSFPAAYISLTYSTLSFPPLPAYFSFLLISLLFSFLLQSLLMLAFKKK